MTPRTNHIERVRCRSTHARRYATSLIGLALICAAPACISGDSEILDGAEGCDELAQGNAASLEIDPKAKEFILASEEVSASITRVSDDVLVACAAMATDLGAEDTWSGEATLKERISNDADTGACDVALLEIDRQLTDAATANVDITVAMAQGECHMDFDAQTACDAECAGNTTCEPGAFESRCEPGSITSICNGDCLAGAFCIGSASVAANCEGHCGAMCIGHCAGKCFNEGGVVTENDDNCHGKCSAHCSGTCSGNCEVDVQAGIACGAGVFCRGTCDGVMESPACTTEFDAPECVVDTACYEACTARMATEATCSPASVTVIADISASPDFGPLVATLNAHLPTLVEAAQAEGKLIQTAGTRMADAGHDLHERADELDGKSLACVGSASTALADAVDTITVSVKASLDVQTEVNVQAEAAGTATAEAGSGM